MAPLVIVVLLVLGLVAPSKPTGDTREYNCSGLIPITLNGLYPGEHKPNAFKFKLIQLRDALSSLFVDGTFQLGDCHLCTFTTTILTFILLCNNSVCAWMNVSCYFVKPWTELSTVKPHKVNWTTHWTGTKGST